MQVLKLIKTWILPLSMVSGVASYFIVASISSLVPYRGKILDVVGVVQPMLIFFMLFLAFCKVELREIKFRKWHLWLLMVQLSSFSLLAATALFIPDNSDWRVIVESAMLCLICPTATASAVVVKKLGGSAADVTTYTVLINLFAAILISVLVPMLHSQGNVSFTSAFVRIVSRVFPLLLCPFLAALMIRYFIPLLHGWLCGFFNLSFYLWTIALALAVATTTRSIMHTELSWIHQTGIAVVSLVCCVIQFWAGRKIGRRLGDRITAGQALGQKNTVLAIWVGYTFFTPITSIAGGFYSIWHNLVNSYQLYRHQQEHSNGN